MIKIELEPKNNLTVNPKTFSLNNFIPKEKNA
jgi:hypothetical protein